MTPKLYILTVVGIAILGLILLGNGERDTALILFGLLIGFFKDILNIKEDKTVEETIEKVETQPILSQEDKAAARAEFNK